MRTGPRVAFDVGAGRFGAVVEPPEASAPPSPLSDHPARPMTTVHDRLRRAAVWTAAAAAVLVVPGLVAPDPPAAVAVLTAVVHLAVFAGVVVLWARTVPRLRPLVLVAAVFAAVVVQAVQAEAASGWALQTRLLWADVVGIGLGWALDRAYRRRPLPDLPLVRPRPDGGGAGSTDRPGGVLAPSETADPAEADPT